MIEKEKESYVLKRGGHSYVPNLHFLLCEVEIGEPLAPLLWWSPFLLNLPFLSVVLTGLCHGATWRMAPACYGANTDIFLYSTSNLCPLSQATFQLPPHLFPIEFYLINVFQQEKENLTTSLLVYKPVFFVFLGCGQM